MPSRPRAFPGPGPRWRDRRRATGGCRHDERPVGIGRGHGPGQRHGPGGAPGSGRSVRRRRARERRLALFRRRRAWVVRAPHALSRGGSRRVRGTVACGAGRSRGRAATRRQPRAERLSRSGAPLRQAGRGAVTRRGRRPVLAGGRSRTPRHERLAGVCGRAGPDRLRRCTRCARDRLPARRRLERARQAELRDHVGLVVRAGRSEVDHGKRGARRDELGQGGRVPGAGRGGGPEIGPLPLRSSAALRAAGQAG